MGDNATGICIHMGGEGICIHMGGDKCAMEYCDYWNNEKQKCSQALLIEKQIEATEASISISSELKGFFNQMLKDSLIKC